MDARRTIKEVRFSRQKIATLEGNPSKNGHGSCVSVPLGRMEACQLASFSH